MPTPFDLEPKKGLFAYTRCIKPHWLENCYWPCSLPYKHATSDVKGKPPIRIIRFSVQQWLLTIQCEKCTIGSFQVSLWLMYMSHTLHIVFKGNRVTSIPSSGKRSICICILCYPIPGKMWRFGSKTPKHALHAWTKSSFSVPGWHKATGHQQTWIIPVWMYILIHVILDLALVKYNINK